MTRRVHTACSGPLAQVIRWVAAAGLVAASSACGSPAAPLDVAPSVDLSQFQGKWYEIARLPRSTQADCNGTTAFYTLAADGSLNLENQCNLGSAAGPLYTVSMTAHVPDPGVPAKLALSVGGFLGDYWILETGPHYEYAVVGHPSRLYWWLLSRTPTLDDATLETVLEHAKAAQFDVSQLEYTPQPLEGERVASPTPIGPPPETLSTGCSLSPRAAPVNGFVAWFCACAVAGARLGSRRRRAAPGRGDRRAESRA